MTNDTIATAYVRVLPDMSGVKGALQGTFDSAGDSAGKSAGGKFAAGLATAGKTAMVALGAAATAVTAFTAKSVNAYAEYEQLVGGVNKLFGESSDKMMKYASEAYKTAGMSANQYMEQATSFAASLIQSYGGDTSKAADQADKAMRAISDNFNTFGGDIQNVQNAYQGFAKQNYTMLDNLKLGYGGTKSEMERLIADANEYAASIGQASDLSIENFGDIVDAIDLIQQKQGIAGTTAKEAASTIEGSLNMVKAAWSNLVVGFSDPNADIGKLIEQTVDAGILALDNLMPAIERALVGIGEGVQKAVPIITEKLPGLVDKLLPPLLGAAADLVNGIVKAIPAILETLSKVIPELITTLTKTSAEMMPQLVDAGLQMVISIVQGIAENIDMLVPAIVESILLVIQTIIDNLPLILDAVLEVIVGVVKGILDALPLILDALPEIILGIVNFILDAIPQIIDAVIQIIFAIIDAFPTILTEICKALPEIITGVIDALLSHIGDFIAAGIKLLVAIVTDIPAIIAGIVGALPEIITGIIDGFASLFEKETWDKVGDAIVDGLGRGMWAAIENLPIGEMAKGIMTMFNVEFEINSPSKKTRPIGRYVTQGLAVGMEEAASEAVQSASKVSEDILNAFSTDVDLNRNLNVTSTARQAGLTMAAYNEPELFISQPAYRQQTIILEMNQMEFARAVYQANNEETQRVGVRLQGGFA